MSNFKTTLSLEDSWQLWLYEFPDFPTHYCFYLKDKVDCNYQCWFCKQVNKLKFLHKKISDDWMSYFKKDCIYKNAHTMLRSIELSHKLKCANILPSKLANYIFFNKKLGRAFFREGIPPNYEDPQNNNGGNFQLLLLGTTGNKELLKDFDKIFLICFKNLIDNEGNIDKRLNGIFLRCEINPGKFLNKNIDNYTDLKNLPFMVKIELWIRDQIEDYKIMSQIASTIEEQINKEIKFPDCNTMTNFHFDTNNQRQKFQKNLDILKANKVKLTRSEFDNNWRN